MQIDAAQKWPPKLKNRLSAFKLTTSMLGIVTVCNRKCAIKHQLNPEICTARLGDAYNRRCVHSEMCTMIESLMIEWYANGRDVDSSNRFRFGRNFNFQNLVPG